VTGALLMLFGVIALGLLAGAEEASR